MAVRGTYDYECPQFVNFAAGLNNSGGKEEIYFDCDDQPTAEYDEVFQNLRTPDATVKTKYLSEAAENNLMTKMTAALSFIENTPSLARIKKHQSENATLKKPHFRFGLNTCIRNTLHVPSTRLHRSKSVFALHKKANKEMGIRKRSSSLNDLRVVTAKKQTFPMTPMCLKRTINKSKNKNIKTTEEIELEEISRLQKQLYQHLRYNELSMKKLNLKPKQSVYPKISKVKPENLKEVAEKGLPFLQRFNFGQKDTRRDLRELSHDAVKKEALKVDAIINKYSRCAEKSTKENRSIRLKKAVAISEVEEKEADKVSQKPLPLRKVGFHSGLLFHDNAKKSTVVKPFSFDFKHRESKAESAGSENITSVSSMPPQNPKLCACKENIPVNRVRPLCNVKNLKVLHQKVDSVKRVEPVKRSVDKRVTIKNRGFPLSENIARN